MSARRSTAASKRASAETKGADVASYSVESITGEVEKAVVDDDDDDDDNDDDDDDDIDAVAAVEHLLLFSFFLLHLPPSFLSRKSASIVNGIRGRGG